MRNYEKIVDAVRRMAAEGASVRQIAGALTKARYETIRGGKTWWPSGVQGIARREGIRMRTATKRRKCKGK